MLLNQKIPLSDHSNFTFSLNLIKDYCLGFIVKEDNFYEIVMSSEFVNLEKPLMVEIIRKRLNPGKNIEIRYDRAGGEEMKNDSLRQLNSSLSLPVCN